MQQAIPALPYNWPLFRETLQEQGFSDIKLATNGIVSATKNTMAYHFVMDYLVKKSTLDNHSTGFKYNASTNASAYQKWIFSSEDAEQEAVYWQQKSYVFTTLLNPNE